MQDYSELVKALRRCATMTCKGDECKYMILGCHDCFPKLHDDAAAAIEELQQIADHYEQTAKDYWKEACEYKAQLSKRGEIVRCGECRWVHICRIGQHLGLDGFCSKGEREVQDGENES